MAALREKMLNSLMGQLQESMIPIRTKENKGKTSSQVRRREMKRDQQNRLVLCMDLKGFFAGCADKDFFPALFGRCSGGISSAGIFKNTEYC